MFSENRQEHQILSQEKTCSYGLYFVIFFFIINTQILLFLNAYLLYMHDKNKL